MEDAADQVMQPDPDDLSMLPPDDESPMFAGVEPEVEPSSDM